MANLSRRKEKIRTFCLFHWMLLMLTSMPIFAQQSHYEQRPYLTLKSIDTTAIKNLLRQSDSLFTVDQDEAKRRCLQAAFLSKSIGFSNGIILSYQKAASQASQRGSWDTTVSFYMELLPYVEAPPHYKRYAAIAYNCIGTAYFQLGRMDQSLNYFYKSLDALGRGSRGSNSTDSMGIYNNMGGLWLFLHEYSQAHKYFTTARVLSERKNDTARMIISYNNLGGLFIEQGSLDSSEQWYNKGLQLLQFKEEPATAISILGNMAIISSKKQKYKEAFQYIDRARDLLKLHNHDHDLAQFIDASLGTIHFDMKNYELATPILLKVYADAKKMGSRQMMLRVGGMIAKAYAEFGAYDNAYRQLLAQNALSDTIAKEQKSRFFELYINAHLADKDRAMLQQQLFIVRQRNQLQQKNYLVTGIVSCVLLLLAVGFAMSRNNRQKQAIQRAQIAHLKQQQEINMLKAKVQGEQEERIRIGRELHDNIASQLWAIKLNVESLNQEPEQWPVWLKKLKTVNKQLIDASQDVRKTAHNLMPDLLLEEGLSTALASVCERTRTSAGIDVDFQEYGIVPSLDKEIELSLYRMIQELIQNVLKHADNATYLLVQLSCANMLLNITVEDNGNGYTNKKEGIGLQQIRKRTAALQGHFDVQSTLGKGTTAYLEFDLQRFL